jgi:ABC-2 type transport system permease protein
VKKIGYVAAREFLGTVLTKGFIVGVLMTPALLTIVFAVAPRLMSQRGSVVRGQVAVIDPTRRVTPELRVTMSPAEMTRRREETARRAIANAPAAVRDIAVSQPTTQSAVAGALGAVPELEIVELQSGADLQAAKAWLTAPANGPRHLALVVIQPDAIDRLRDRDEFGDYDIYVPATIDDRVETAIYESLREAFVNVRLRARNMDRQTVDALVRVPRPRSVTLTQGGERATVGAFNRILPLAFTGLLLMGVLMGGQGLVTSTVEEKSSRVVEVLLSAVSPIELMAGKILGQMAVSLVILAIYIALALLALASFAMLGLVDPVLIVYLVIFFIITYLTIGSLMAAAGAAVNEMREAQQLVMPMMLALMIPWVLATPIARAPNSPFSTLISFIPPVNTFAMLLRLTSTAPPPAWQVWLTILIGIGSVTAAIWFAAKVFRIGLLMYGKPPDLATLIRWARSA